MNEATGHTAGESHAANRPVETRGSDPPDPDGISLISGFAYAAAKHSEEMYGPFPPYCDRHDVTQLTHLYLRISEGPDYVAIIAAAAARSPTQEDYRKTAAFGALRAAANQAIGACRWRDDKRAQRGQNPSPLYDASQAAYDHRAAIELAFDLKEAMSHELSELERDVLELRQQGYTCEEIAQKISLSDKQEASKIARDAITKLNRHLARPLEEFK